MKWFCCIFLFAISTGSYAQSPVKYHISFDNADHHEAEISVIFSEVSSSPLEIRMSRTSPGRYSLHEFAKNVYQVKAVDSQGKELQINRPNPHQWDVSGHDGTVKITYTIFGDRCDGTYLAVDNTHAHINMPATFMWARGLEKRPIEITFTKPKRDWQIATQLVPTKKLEIFTAPNLDYFMDSPTEISDFELRQWSLGANGAAGEIRLALHHDGSDEEVDSFAEMCKAVVEEQVAIFGEAPAFDNSTYIFIADYLPHISGDGMEHRNSTILTSTRSLDKHAVRNLGTVSHEFFHAWNVERIRPVSLEPFDFEKANMSGELWFAEGFTRYYDALVLKRAELISIDRFSKNLSGLLNDVLNGRGRRYFSAVEMSMQAPLVDRARSNDPRNLSNTFISYYTYGAAIGLGLDLTLRNNFPGVTLDDFMRAVWERHGKPEVPYTNGDLRDILGEVTGDIAFAAEFFANYVQGHKLVNYEELLTRAGLLLRRAKEDEAWIGRLQFKFEKDKAIVETSTLSGSPLYQAGLDHGDNVIGFDGQAPESKEDFEEILKKHKPGDKVEIEFEKNGIIKKVELLFQSNPEFEVIPYEQAGTTLTEEMLEFRQNWLGTRLGIKAAHLKRYCPQCSRAFPFENEFCRFDGEELKITQKKGNK